MLFISYKNTLELSPITLRGVVAAGKYMTLIVRACIIGIGITVMDADHKYHTETARYLSIRGGVKIERDKIPGVGYKT